MEISVLAQLDVTMEIVKPTERGEEDTLAGFAINHDNLDQFIADVKGLVRNKFNGATYEDLLEAEDAHDRRTIQQAQRIADDKIDD